jgi:hypothetical protein
MRTGYYWVLVNGIWEIGYFRDAVWKLCGSDDDFYTDDFEQVGERIDHD